MTNIYVVVEEYNQYDQMGAYFKGIYCTYEEALASIDHVGRLDSEDSWNEILYVPLGTTLTYNKYGCIDTSIFPTQGLK